MSGRVRKQSECPAGKQGPMRATLPVSSVMKSGGLRKNAGNSPTLSPTNVWRRVSPDHALSGQRSPGAVNYKGKARLGASVIRRTASLDTLCHTGQWPRDYYFHSGQLQVDKSTQTEEGGCAVAEDERLERFLRARMQRRTSPHDHHHHQPFWSRLGTHSSVEGLNQEIERLVLHPAAPPIHPRAHDKSTPEGHRAPLAELLRRSVNTQTPAHHSSDPPSPSSLSSVGSTELLAAGGSVCSSPEEGGGGGSRLGASPQINRFLAREPPDGCEKVYLRAGDGVRCGGAGAGGAEAGGGDGCVVTAAPFTLRPSLRSAFLPLHAPTSPSPPPPPPPLDT